MTEDGVVVLDVPLWVVVSLWATVATFFVWLALTLVVYMRRKASNLTPVNAPGVRKSAAPDFLKVDHKARAAQIARGEAFEEELTEREIAEASAEAGVEKAVWWRNLAGIATFLFSLFSLASTVVGVIWQVDRMGAMLGEVDKLEMVVRQYPVPVAVATFVIGFYIVQFFVQKKWRRAPSK